MVSSVCKVLFQIYNITFVIIHCYNFSFTLLLNSKILTYLTPQIIPTICWISTEITSCVLLVFILIYVIVPHAQKFRLVGWKRNFPRKTNLNNVTLAILLHLSKHNYYEQFYKFILRIRRTLVSKKLKRCIALYIPV